MSVRSAAISCLMPQCEKFNTPKPRISFVVPFSPLKAPRQQRPGLRFIKENFNIQYHFLKNTFFFSERKRKFSEFYYSRRKIFLSKNFKNFKLDKILFSVRIGKHEPEVELFRGLYALWYCCRYLQGKFRHHHCPPWPIYPFKLAQFFL